MTVHAVAIQPKDVALIEARDVNAVTQALPGKTFDLVVATNILIYDERFQQTVAMRMNPGGVFCQIRRCCRRKGRLRMAAQHDQLDLQHRRGIFCNRGIRG